MSKTELKGLIPAYFILVLLGLLVFGYTGTFEVLLFDDKAHIFENPAVVTGNLGYIWSHIYFGMYIPVTYSLWSLFGQYVSHSPAAFHLLNVFFHVANGIAVFMILRRLKFSNDAALTSAALFLLHPANAEAVAWISGLKDVLSFFFCALAIIFWLSDSTLLKRLTFLPLLLAVLAKPAAAPLPVFLLVASFLLESGREAHKPDFKKRLFASIVPLLGVLFTFVLGFYLSGTQGPALLEHRNLNLYERLLVAIDAFGFYIIKLLLPLNNLPDYGRIPEKIIDDRLYFINLAVTVLFACGLAFLFYRKKNPFDRRLMLALAFFILFFIPTSGIVPFSFQDVSTTADRYMYYLVLSLAIVLAYGIDRLRPRLALLRILQFALVLALGSAAFNQTLIWKNDEVFFTEMVYGNPESYTGFQNLAVTFEEKSDYAKALALYKKANALRPNRLAPVAGLISMSFKLKQWETLDQLAAAYLNDEKIKTMTDNGTAGGVAYGYYGYSLMERGQKPEALKAFCNASRLSQRAKASLTETVAALKKEVPAELQVCSLE